MRSYKVRFNLGKGKNYMKWKIQHPDGTVEYHSPSEVQLLMHDCILKNHKKTAQKIYDGANKTVCAWVLCKSLAIKRDGFIQVDTVGDRVKYNPRVTPHWMLNGENVDGRALEKIFSVDFGLYTF